MNKLTPEQALADIRAVRRDRNDSHWFACAEVLADALADAKETNRRKLETFRAMSETIENLRAELDSLKSAPAATEPPALARFLPRRPADVPAPPDGWVYVGRGVESNRNLTPSNDISAYISWRGDWSIGDQLGRDDKKPYAVLWTAPADIWHRFGLLAPSEGGGWIPHTPGDAMPCEGRCEVLLKGEIDDAQFRNQPGEVRFGNDWYWDADDADNNIIGWRPALWEVAT